MQSRAVPSDVKACSASLEELCRHSQASKDKSVKKWDQGYNMGESMFFVVLFVSFCFVFTCQRKGLGSESAPRMTSRVLIEVFLHASRAKLSGFIAFAE